jgi:hypothetical protein
MLKKDLFRLAMKAGKYGDLAWLISAFSLSTEPDHEWKNHNDSFRIVSNITGHFVVNRKTNELVKIEDTTADKPIFEFTELVQITPDDIPNCTEELESTYGNWFVNWLLLIHPFKTKIPYMDGNITPGRIENILLKNFKENPKNPNDRNNTSFYVDEYLVYVESIYFLTGLTQISVWSATKKTMLPPPGIAKFKAQLLKENEGNLNDLATIAKIDKALVEKDYEWLKDDPGMNFLIGGKAIDIVRKKKFLMNGAEVGLAENAVKGTLVANSLHEGWDISKFPDMNDTLRAGSFNRGAETQLGGVSVKWLLRASSNMRVTIDDCKSTVGSPFFITEKNKNRIVGFSLVTDTGSVHVNDEEEAGSYLGKHVWIRSPMYCKLDHTDFCKTCLGDRLSINPEGLSLAISAYGSTLLYISLKAMHGKSLKTAKMNYKLTIT